MNKKLFKSELIGFVFVSVLGTVGHFVFEWSDYNRLIGMIVPVNESSWEHLKLLFFPYLIWSAVQYIILQEKDGIIFSKAIGSVAGMTAILAFFYTYTGIIGKNVDWLNILSFFVGVLIAFLCDYVMIRSKKISPVSYDCIGTGIFISFIILFFMFTTAPPFIPLFKDPQTLTYGI